MCLEAAARHENRPYNESIGCTPFFKAFSKRPTLKADEELKIIPVLENAEKPKSQEQRNEYRRKMQESFNKRHPNKAPVIKSGDLILVQSGVTGKHINLNGPHRVRKVFQYEGIPKNVTYEGPNGEEKSAHVSNIRVYHGRSQD